MAKYFVANVFTFNNYYNRTVRKYNTLIEYIENAGLWDEAHHVNFNPNDGITTTFVWGKGEGAPFANPAFSNYDYFILSTYDEEAPEGEREEIISRWFIVESQRTRGGQEKLTLRRDVLADKWEAIRRAPIYVEKGIIKDLESPLLLNNEDARVNQIKKSEYLLRDSTRIAWLVLYLKKGCLGNAGIGPNHDGKITINVSQNDDFVFQELSTPITSWAYYQYIANDYKVSNYDVFSVYYRFRDDLSMRNYDRLFQFWDNNLNSSDTGAIGRTGNLLTADSDVVTKLANTYLPSASSLRTQALNAFGYNVNSSALDAYNGKIIKDSTGKYFQVRVYNTAVSNANVTHNITTADAPALKSAMSNLWNSALGQSVSPDDSAFKVKVNYRALRIELTELPEFTTVVDFGAYTGKGTVDSALFDAICLPYGPCWMRKGGTTLNDQANKERSMLIMQSITTQLTSEWVLDLQLLPYLPARTLGMGANVIVFPDDPSETALIGKYNGDTTDLIAVCNSSNFTLDIWATHNGDYLTIKDDSDVPETYKRKYVNDCTMIRLCSPNYNGVFEFNLAKNGGNIHDFNVDVTLRPYNPYIHANPNFNFLYGQDFNDARGLICGGDFSLGIINDAWNVYEIQNKNYQAIFDRQIQNLDINNAILRQEAGFGAIAGIVQGSASGAAAGGMASGSPYGAIAGAVVGGGASAAGAFLDLQNLRKRQQEARNFAIDNYNLQLGNVRALPNSITKTSALTFNNKLFLYYEIYECSEEEKQAYYRKIKYNGMTVGKIDTIENYTSNDNSNYFRGKAIRFPNGTAEFDGYNLAEDYHFAEVINEELMKGVFI